MEVCWAPLQLGRDFFDMEGLDDVADLHIVEIGDTDATLITLLLVPSLYLMLEDSMATLKRFFGTEPDEGAS